MGRVGGAWALGALGNAVVATGAKATDTESDLNMAGTLCSRDGGRMGAVDAGTGSTSTGGMRWQTQRVFPRDQWSVRLHAVEARLRHQSLHVA